MREEVLQYIAGNPAFKALRVALEAGKPGEPVHVSGLSGSLHAVALAALTGSQGRQLLVITPERDAAERLRDDLLQLLDERSVRLFIRQDQSRHAGAPSSENIEALRALLSDTPAIVITHAGGLAQLLPNPSSLRRALLSVSQGEEPGFAATVEELSRLGFEKKDFVETSGDYSVRGGILDVFPFVGENPVRIEFTGDVVESIREFDVLSQRSIKQLTTAAIIPNLLGGDPAASPSSCTLLDFLRSDAAIVLHEHERIEQSINGDHSAVSLGWPAIAEQLALFRQVHIASLHRHDRQQVDFGSVSQPAFNGSVGHLREYLAKLHVEGYTIFLMSDTQSEMLRLKDLVGHTAGENGRDGAEMAVAFDPASVNFTVHSFHEGFIIPGSRLAVLTEHQVFNRVKRRGPKRKPRFRGFSSKEVQQLQRGDFVVHADYGIGMFDGMLTISVNSVMQEVLKLRYEDNDVLYVNLNYLHKVQKYASKEGHIPKLTKLGRPEWERLKARAKKRIKDIARDLIRLYAKRKQAQGFAFDPDTAWQKELEASFMYEDTFDQAKSTREVKDDMEAPHPMDRLICGDVGFGKTEVAVRAAFKAVLNAKQVAVLVPTTILALQHYNTFADRTSRYSTNIQMLSRFKSRKEQQSVLESLKAGGVDILIGTHRLLSKDVEFKDLGLLIIDEEHRFGVAAKEKLRQLKADVDTLTLTATPIPRTLHFSLMGARDLSIIATPPRNRLPVITEITRYSDDLTREAIVREVQRGGQVYFVHDRVQDIDDVAQRLQELLPGIRVRSAHGQMHAHMLEEVMLEFLQKRFDVLVCTKIIESGLDIPNVNTIIINRADRFGMAELYQLRGRVGRSNTQAYAYLLTAPIGTMPKNTLMRLQALEEFTELGAGFHLAMRDLEIRGAGNLLGGEQSGFIESMGFETYTRILEDAVAELKEEEFEHLFAGEARRRAVETMVEADIEALIPKEYVGNDTERLEIYRRLYSVTSREQLNEVADELRDRFGPHPDPFVNLLGVVRLRLLAGKIGFVRINIKGKRVECEFPPPVDTRFYESDDFQLLMTKIGNMKGRGVYLQNTKSGLTLVAAQTIQGQDPLRFARALLEELILPTLGIEQSQVGKENAM